MDSQEYPNPSPGRYTVFVPILKFFFFGENRQIAEVTKRPTKWCRTVHLFALCANEKHPSCALLRFKSLLQVKREVSPALKKARRKNSSTLSAMLTFPLRRTTRFHSRSQSRFITFISCFLLMTSVLAAIILGLALRALFIAAILALASSFPLPEPQGIQPIIPLSNTSVSLFKTYTLFSSIAYCSPSAIGSWSCGGEHIILSFKANSTLTSRLSAAL